MKEFLSKYFDLGEYDRWPVIGMFIPMFIGLFTDHLVSVENQLYVTVLFIAFLVVCVWQDARNMKEAGFDHPWRGWVLLIPVYLFRRDNVTKKKNHRIFLAWMLLFCVSVANGVWAMNKDQNYAVEQDVCSVLDTLDSLKENNVTCVRAYNMEEQYDGYWKGSAHLSNNRDVNVSADYNKYKGQVYVQIHSLLVE